MSSTMYEFRVDGRLSENVGEAFCGMQLGPNGQHEALGAEVHPRGSAEGS
jgi:hypothetical protein